MHVTSGSFSTASNESVIRGPSAWPGRRRMCLILIPQSRSSRSSATVRPTVPYPSSPMFNWGSVFVKGDSLTLQD